MTLVQVMLRDAVGYARSVENNFISQPKLDRPHDTSLLEEVVFDIGFLKISLSILPNKFIDVFKPRTFFLENLVGFCGVTFTS